MEQFLQDHVYSMVHWPWFAVCITLMIIVQTVKTNIFTKKKAYEKGKLQWLFWWGWKTLALQPIIAGAIIGLLWGNPEPGVKEGIASFFYFASSGGCSVVAYQVLKGVLKKKKVDISLPGQRPTDPPSKESKDEGKDKKGD